MSKHQAFPNPDDERLWTAISRRRFLARAGGGFTGAVAAAMLGQHALANEHPPAVVIDAVHPLRERTPHFAAKAKRLIFLFMYGGPSQVDTFDYKPVLQSLHDQPAPEAIMQLVAKERVRGVFGPEKYKLLASPFKFQQYGQSGLWFSELHPKLARHADDLCFIRSLHCDAPFHAPAAFQMNTGEVNNGKPSVGSWVTYGLGSENENLPGFVLLFESGPLGGAPNWGNAFLPAAFQGTRFRDQGIPVLYLKPPNEVARMQRSTLDLLRELNQKHQAQRNQLLDLDARIASYELAYRMQTEAVDVGNLSDETAETLEMYGIDDPNANYAKFARKCLTARRLAQRGVRFVQLYSSYDTDGWDAHTRLEANHREQGRMTDQPIAALLTDLKRLGLLDETLVVCVGEFGRTPMAFADGRNHNPYGFTAWLAGGGVKGGQAIGETDEIGLRAVVDPHSVKDLHATILAALGLRSDDLTFEHNGRPERLTGVAASAKVIPGVFA